MDFILNLCKVLLKLFYFWDIFWEHKNCSLRLEIRLVQSTDKKHLNLSLPPHLSNKLRKKNQFPLPHNWVTKSLPEKAFKSHFCWNLYEQLSQNVAICRIIPENSGKTLLNQKTSQYSHNPTAFVWKLNKKSRKNTKANGNLCDTIFQIFQARQKKMFKWKSICFNKNSDENSILTS